MDSLPEQLAQQLEETGTKIVLAESCTSGLAAATLARVPGISAWLCGSAVTYRQATKQAWLQVSPETLAQFTAESEEVTCEMALGVLQQTAEAQLSAAITGDLGPGVDPAVDGVVYTAIAVREEESTRLVFSGRHKLQTSTRTERQAEAAELLLAEALQVLKQEP